MSSAADITLDALAPLLIDPPQILLIGCGERFLNLPLPLRAALKERGSVLEWMDTGAACRTFNVLLAEERSVAAALISPQAAPC